MKRCNVRIVVSLTPFTYRLCGEPAIATVTEGCVHEHLGEADVCAAHELAGRVPNNELGCSQCYELNAHRCPLLRDEMMPL